MATDRSDFQLVNYRFALGAGILLGLLGMMTKFWGMAIFGMILLVIGLVNKRQWGKEKMWSELSPSGRKSQLISLIITAGVGLALIVGSKAVSE